LYRYRPPPAPHPSPTRRSSDLQATSFFPGASGTPTECTPGTKLPSSPSHSATARPMRVMICMLTATYAESESSTPICAICEPIRSEEHTSELQSRSDLVCRLLL